MDRAHTATANLMDTHERLIADILTRYRTLVMLATVHAEGDRANEKPEAVAVTGLSMQMEFDGLYSSIKELLSLTRQMKELWVFGALGQDSQDQKAREAQIDRDVAQVTALLDKVESTNMKQLAEENGGSWQPLGDKDAEGQAPPATGGAPA